MNLQSIIDDPRDATIALALITVIRGLPCDRQLVAVRDALPRLVDLGLVRLDEERKCRLTDAGREMARDFVRHLRAEVRKLGEKSRAA